MIFLEPLFLAGVLAALAPVLMHLMHRRQAPEVPFATLRFLKASARRTRRRQVVEDAALLAVRVLTLVLIALALAHPVATNLGRLWGSGQSTAVAIVLDNSASMGAAGPGGQRFEAAKTSAAEILDLLRDGDAVALLPTGGPATGEQGKLYHAHETVRRALADCQVSGEKADLAARLRQARELLAGSDAPNREIYVLTDNQALSWRGLPGEPAEAGGVPVAVVNFGGDPPANVALKGVRLESPVLAVGVPLAAAAEVVNPSPLPQSATLELYLGGEKVAASPTLALSPGAAAGHTFHFTLDRPGVHRGEVRLAEADANPMDNSVYFAAAVDRQIPVAVVKAQRHEIPIADDGFYLERALSPAGGEGWPLQARSFTAAELAGASLADYPVVYCVNLPPPDPDVAARLAAYVEGGGHLFWVCGGNVDPTGYNAANDSAGGRLLPAPLGPLQDGGGAASRKVVSLDGSHPALAQLTEPASLYQSVLVHKYFPAAADGGAQVLARLEGGDPLLLYRPVGAGSVWLLTTAARVEWTNLPLRPIFLPLVARLTFHLAGVHTQQSQRLAGAPLAVPLPRGGGVTAVEVVDPANETRRLPVGAEAGATFVYPETHRVGTYLVRLLGAGQPRQLVYAVNPDPEESDAATATPEELTRRLGERTLVYCDNPAELAAAVRRFREGTSLWELGLWAVLGVLLLEAYLANCRARFAAGSNK